MSSITARRSEAASSALAVRTYAVGRRRARLGVRIRKWVLSVAVCLLIVVTVPSDGYLGPARTEFELRQAIGSHGFRLAAWEVQALAQKARDLVAQPDAGLTPQEQHDIVLAYVASVDRIGDLSGAIERIYADPNEKDPKAAAAPLQAELDGLRAKQAHRRPAVERTLERQTAEVLDELGLSVVGRVRPPVSFQFTESPLYLIVSPRNQIRVQEGMYLDPSLALQQMEQIESQVQDRLDVSALVDGTGGFSSYPTMVIEYPSLEWVLSTIAHEWVHIYLTFYPLGWHYGDSGDTRTLNETVSSIAGDEIGRLLILRFYPELVPPDSPQSSPSSQPGWQIREKQDEPFEFGAFMRETRLHVDTLLSEGRVAEAEAYMEARRKALVERGYIIRKLNQAYFAFHGSYAVGPAATDPIGGKLRALRGRSKDLAVFLRTVAHITDVAGLDAAIAQASTP